jgi:hypothetical protein
MPLPASERSARAIVDSLREKLDTLPTDPSDIRAAALALFTKQLDGKLANLQDGETLQITFRVDIIGNDNTVRGGSGAERNMPEYIAWRTSVFTRDGFTCQDCRSKQRLNAHHIKPWSQHPALRFEVSNGVTLCFDCHAAKHPHLRFMRDGKTDKAGAEDPQAAG